MALSGTFLADFNAFVIECMKADEGLNQIKLSAAAAEKQIDKLVDDFNGQRVVTEAVAMMQAVERIGGASKLTQAELERVGTKAAEAAAKIRAMGDDVPPILDEWAKHAKKAGDDTEAATKKSQGGFDSMLGSAKGIAAAMGVAFSVDTVIRFGQHILQTADDLVRLSDQTGMTITELQRLDYTSEQSGNTLDQLTQASSKLQASLETVKGQDAVEKFGVDFEKLRAADPYQQLLMISDAFRGISDPVERSRRAVELFGETGAKILPTLLSDMRKVGEAATTSGDETTRALAAAGDAWDGFKKQVSNATVGAAGAIILAGQQVTDQGLMATMAEWVKSGGRMDVFLAKLMAMQVAAQETSATFAQLTADAANIGKAGAGLGDIGAEKPRLTPREIAEQERMAAEAKRDAERAAKDLAAAEAELNQIRLGQEGILAGIADETRAAVEADLALGASQQTLATAYGLTKTQIAAIAEVYRQNEKAAEDGAKAEIAASALVTKLRTEHAQEQARANATAKQKELLDLGTWRAAQMQALADTKGATVEMYAEVARIYDERLTALTAQTQGQRELTAEQQRMFTEASAGYAQMLTWMKQIPPLQDVIIAGFNQFDFTRWNEAEAKATEFGERARLIGDYMAANGVSVETATKALEEQGRIGKESTDAVAGGMNAARQQTDAATGALRQMSAGFQEMGQAASSAYERAIAGANLLAAYSKAGVAMSGDIGLGGYNFDQLKRTGVPGGLAGIPWAQGAAPWDASTPWGRPGATQTSNTLNVNVNSSDAGKIAEKLVTEMRHAGVRL